MARSTAEGSGPNCVLMEVRNSQRALDPRVERASCTDYTGPLALLWVLLHLVSHRRAIRESNSFRLKNQMPLCRISQEETSKGRVSQVSKSGKRQSALWPIVWGHIVDTHIPLAAQKSLVHFCCHAESNRSGRVLSTPVECD